MYKPDSATLLLWLDDSDCSLTPPYVLTVVAVFVSNAPLVVPPVLPPEVTTGVSAEGLWSRRWRNLQMFSVQSSSSK